MGKREKLINGMTPIKDMIYYNQRLKLLKMYDKVKELEFDIKGIKTDCILYKNSDSETLKDKFEMSSKIGAFKIKKNKYLVDSKLETKNNELIKPELFNTNIKTFDDEYNTQEINEYLKNNKQILIKGLYPGVGKSTIAKNYDKSALFICPYNRLCQEIMKEIFNSFTYCKLFGLVGSDEEMKNIKGYDISEYNTIVFDEIFLYEPQRLKRISELMEKFPDKKYIALGDMQQRDPISFNNSDYLNNCIRKTYSIFKKSESNENI